MGERQHSKQGFLLCLIFCVLLQGSPSQPGSSHAYNINCTGFDLYGVDPAAFQAVFDRKAFRPVINNSIPTQVNISFTLSAILDVDAQIQVLTSFLWVNMIWENPFISWNPEECGGLSKISVSAKNLWLPDIFIIEFMDVDQTPTSLSAYVYSNGRIKYDKPMKVTSICNLDIFYFPFDQQNCTLTFSSFLYTVDSLLLGMEKEVWEITDNSRDVIRTQGEWELLGINKATPKLAMGSSLYDQIMFYVAIRRRPRLYVINLLVPSGFLIAIDALSFFLPIESGNRAPFKMTLLLGYTVFLLMMNDLLPASGTPLISVYFALCLSLMVLSLLEAVFLTYLLNLIATEPPAMPPWLQSLLLRYLRGCYNKRSQKETRGSGPDPIHLPGLMEPVVMAARVPGSSEARLNGDPGSTRVPLEQQTQGPPTVNLWGKFCLILDSMLFWLYLLFMATALSTIIVLWNS
ncbi:5-hydroxytryptamine receptor 3C-like [Dromiciops gliroides]|uniref:5-hydroxytryptamine receptor 3C-like n=1 Tax=Dromiciops gliroides TaxID=33562 RepID=UPI001CC7082C|nr:5-hydroxytryptamine receptor 3C-like [Dromiciops gliroides]